MIGSSATISWTFLRRLVAPIGSMGFNSGLWVRRVNSIIEKWPLVCGTGSLLEAHLVGRLGLAEALPGLVGCGTNEQEVWQLSTKLERQGLVILSDSIAADRGVALIRRLRQSRFGQRVRLLAQDCRSGALQRPL